MSTHDNDLALSGQELAVARRAIAVALVMRVSADEVHPVRGYLPPYGEMLRVLDRIGWVGAPEREAVLGSRERRVLLDTVYAMLILAFEEAIRNIEDALQSASADADPAVLAAAHSLTGLAMRLQDEPVRRPAADRLETVHDDLLESQVSPALRALVDSVGLPVWIATAEFTIEWINPALERLLDAGVDAVRGTPWDRWIDPEDAEKIGQVLNAANLEQRSWSAEVGAGPHGGPYARLLMIAAPRLSSSGALRGWTGICFDVSRNPALPSRLEPVTRSLALEAAKTNMVLRQLPAMIWTTDLDLRCTFSHGAGFRSLGAEPHQLVGRLISEITGSDDPQHPALVAHRGALAGETAHYRDTYAERVFDATVEPLRDQQGAIFGCIGLGIEVTDAVARERELQRLLRQLRFGQAIGRMGSWELDVATGTFTWSEEAYRLLGAEPGGIQPTFETFLGYVHPDDREELLARHRDGQRTGKGYEMWYRLVRGDGEVRRMRGVVRFEHDAVGALIRVAGILQDVTGLTAGGADRP